MKNSEKQKKHQDFLKILGLGPADSVRRLHGPRSMEREREREREGEVD